MSYQPPYEMRIQSKEGANHVTDKNESYNDQQINAPFRAKSAGVSLLIVLDSASNRHVLFRKCHHSITKR